MVAAAFGSNAYGPAVYKVLIPYCWWFLQKR